MNFEKDYKVLLEKAKSAIRHYDLLSEPEEVLSHIYLKLFQKENFIYDSFLFEKEIVNYCAGFKRNEVEFVPYKDRWKENNQHYYIRGEKVCGVCHEKKPVSQFRIVENEIGKKKLRYECLQCEAARGRAYQLTRNKESERARKQTPAAKLAAKKRQQRICKELSDSYILSQFLNKKYSIDYIKEHPSLIEETRQRIIRRRTNLRVKKMKKQRDREKKEAIKKNAVLVDTRIIIIKADKIKIKKQNIKIEKVPIIRQPSAFELEALEYERNKGDKKCKINPLVFSKYNDFADAMNKATRELIA